MLRVFYTFPLVMLHWQPRYVINVGIVCFCAIWRFLFLRDKVAEAIEAGSEKHGCDLLLVSSVCGCSRRLC